MTASIKPTKLDIITIVSMKLGDTTEMGVLFPGLSPMKITWEVIEKTKHTATFCLYYYGVLLGAYEAKITDDLLTFKEVGQ